MRLFFALAFLAGTSIAHATDWNLPPDAIAFGCTGGSEVDDEDCTDKAFQRADAELNEVWKKVLAAIVPDTTAGLTAEMATQWKADLIAAEKAWNTFKETDCNVARSYEYWGGSGRSLAVSSCLYVYTAARLNELRAHYVENAYAQADAELNAVWQKVLASIQPGLGGTLTAAQAKKWKEDLIAGETAWIALRDATCKGVRSFEYGGAGAAGPAVTACLTDYTVARIENLISGDFGDWPSPPTAMPDAGCDMNTDAGITDCLSKAREKADADLNAVQQEALASIVPADGLSAEQVAAWKNAMAAAEKAWSTFRDQDCARAAEQTNPQTQTSSALAVASCLYDHTVDRLNELKARYDANANANAELDTLWQKLLASIHPDDRYTAAQAKEWTDGLIAAQRAWDSMRNAYCKGARSFEYGEVGAAGPAVTACLYDYTTARIEDLRARWPQYQY